MSEFKGTPGPWHRLGSVIKPVCGRERKLAEVRVTDSEGVANAKLIAVAPELLEALQGLLAAYNDPGNTGSTHDDKVSAARTAITKATE